MSEKYVKKNRLVIIGASGHGKVVADIALKMECYKNIFFLDDDESLIDCMGFPVIGKSEEAASHYRNSDIFIAVGNAEVRQTLQQKLELIGASIPTLIHPAAIIGTNVKIGQGTVVMAGSVINSDSVIGKGCIINTCSSVDHDCNIADYVHIAVGAHLAGTVDIGTRSWIGIGAVVSNNINIISDCMIGAGAVVIKNITKNGTYIGVPAKKMIGK